MEDIAFNTDETLIYPVGKDETKKAILDFAQRHHPSGSLKQPFSADKYTNSSENPNTSSEENA